jgi:hypothetical protein
MAQTGQMACSTAGTSASSQDHCKVQLKLGRTGGLEDLSALSWCGCIRMFPSGQASQHFLVPVAMQNCKAEGCQTAGREVQLPRTALSLSGCGILVTAFAQGDGPR